MEYRFPVSEGLGCAEALLRDHDGAAEVGVTAEVVVQAALEQFGLSFTRPVNLDPYRVLLRVESISEAQAEQTHHDIMRVLRRMLPWTEGPPMDDVRLVGKIQYTTLTVDERPREVDVLALSHQIAQEDAWVPRRIRQAYGIP
jgi:hypothetical protein